MLLFLLGTCSAQLFCGEIHFAQFTDPHLFDPDQQATNEFVFQWCIDSVNTNIACGERYSFIVLTGDIGLDKIGGLGTSRGGGQSAGVRNISPADVAYAADVVARHVISSKVNRWLFVPGNNDLPDENPTNIWVYRDFMRALADRTSGQGFIVRDLTTRNGDLSAAWYEEPAAPDSNRCLFIGFNNASFKSNGNPTNAIPFEAEQLNEVTNVQRLLAAKNQAVYKGVFVFYHIPEIEDPWLGSLLDGDTNLMKRQLAPGFTNAYPRSAWLTTDAVRSAWEVVVTNAHIRGLFAGHFHSPDRAIYEGSYQMREPERYVDSRGKLFVAPPIAIKNQLNSLKPARGYREITIDPTLGAITGNRVVFYDPSSRVTENSGTQKANSNPTGRMVVNLVVVPGLALLIFGIIAFVWRSVIQKTHISTEDPAYSAVLMLGLALCAVVIGFAALAMLAECQGCDVCRVVGVGSLWGLASLAVGGAGGILFGIPRAYGQQEPASTPRPRTNLDEVSDWLTKLIIGGTLFESKNLFAYLGEAGGHFARTVSSCHTDMWSGVGSSLLVYFGVVGFFGAYFPMRLYLARAIDEADSGRSVLGRRTSLPEDKLKALEDVPLNIEKGRPVFDAVTEAAAKSIISIPLATLVDLRDIRLWAKANLGLGNWDAAIQGYLQSFKIGEQDAETRLGYAVALREKKADGDLILSQLRRARESLTVGSPGPLLEGVYKSLIFQCLYLQRPQSFQEALGFAREYFMLSRADGTAGLWTNIACAYAQAFSWLKEDPTKEIKDPAALYINSNQPRFEAGPSKELQRWLMEQALMAVRRAISADPSRKSKLQGLMGEGFEKSEIDNDLAVFANENEFRGAVGLPLIPAG